MAGGDKCTDQACWEAKNASASLGLSPVDVGFRLVVCACVLLHARRQGRGGGLAAVLGLCACVLVLGNAFSALAVLLNVLSRVHHHRSANEDAESEGKEDDGNEEEAGDDDDDNNNNNPLPFPRFRASPTALAFLTLTALAFHTRCTALSSPRFLIFDEVHFGKFMNGHITGEFYFDIHPPLVKLVMARFVQWGTPWYNGEQPFRDIGEEYLPDSPVKAMRFIPALASSLLVPVTFLTARELGMSGWAAVVCSSMVLFDNLQVTEGRVLTTDTSLLFFMACSLYFHIRTENSRLFTRRWYMNVALTGVFMGFTVSTKWIALNIVGVVGVCTAVDVIVRGHLGLSWRHGFDPHRVHLHDLGTRLFLLLGVPACIYAINFFFWIRTTPKWGEFGPYHMPRAFQASLIGAPSNIKADGPPPSFWQTFVQMNTAMFTGNRDVGKGQKGHPWESWWYQWPLNLRGLACWSSGQKFSAAKGAAFEQHVYFLGNPFVWWFAALCGCLLVFVLLTPRKPRLPIPNFGWKVFMLMLGYFSGILPYVAVRRSCFIYHYMPPLHFLVLASGLVCDNLVFRYFRNYRVKLLFVGVLVAVFAWSFHFFGILSYGTSVTKRSYEMRLWRGGWR